jgi:hypothetical protein
VQIQINVSSSSYLLPSPTAFQGPEDQPVLAQHRAAQQPYFDEAAAG